MEERHVYTIKPRRPIRGLIKGKIFIKPTNLLLSKDEVLMCMTHGPVYRKFYLDGTERVTPSNLDRLHRSEHLTEDQYKALVGTVNDSTIDTKFIHYEKKEPVSEDIPEVNEELSEEKIKEDIEDIVPAHDITIEAIFPEEDDIDKVSIEDTVEESISDNEYSYNEIDEESKKVEEEQLPTGDEEESSPIDDLDSSDVYNNTEEVPVVKKKRRRSSKKKAYPNQDVNVPETVNIAEVNEK